MERRIMSHQKARKTQKPNLVAPFVYFCGHLRVSICSASVAFYYEHSVRWRLSAVAGLGGMFRALPRTGRPKADSSGLARFVAFSLCGLGRVVDLRGRVEQCLQEAQRPDADRHLGGWKRHSVRCGSVAGLAERRLVPCGLGGLAAAH